MKRILLLSLVVVVALFSQTTARPTFELYQECSGLSTAACVITIQVPALSTKTIHFLAAAVYCSVVCDKQIDIMGGTATTTLTTPFPLGLRTAPTIANGYTSSNATAGTIIAKITSTGAGADTFDMSPTSLSPGYSGVQNLNVRTGAITGTARCWVIYEETP